MALILTPSAAPGRIDTLLPKAGARGDESDPTAAASFGDILARSLQADETIATDGDKEAAPLAPRRRGAEPKDDLQDLVNALALAIATPPGSASKATAGERTDMSTAQAAVDPDTAADAPAASAADGVQPALTARSLKSTRATAVATRPDDVPVAASVSNALASIGANVEVTAIAPTMTAADQPAIKQAAPTRFTPLTNGLPAVARTSVNSARAPDAMADQGIAPTTAAAEQPAVRQAAPATLTPRANAVPAPAHSGPGFASAPDTVTDQVTAPTTAPAQPAAVPQAAQTLLAPRANAAPVAARSGPGLAPESDAVAETTVAQVMTQATAPATMQAVQATFAVRSTGEPMALRSSAEAPPAAGQLATQAIALSNATDNDSAPRDDNRNRQTADAAVPTLNMGAALHAFSGATPAHGPAAVTEPGAQPAMTVSSLTPEVGSSEWGKALGQQLSQLGRGLHQVAELQLNPPGLGPLKVTLNMNNQQMEALFVSAHSQVRAAVEAALPQLRASLADSGISLGHTSVSADSQPQAAFSQAQDGRSGQRSYRDNARLGTQDSSAPALKPALRPDRGLSIDTYA